MSGAFITAITRTLTCHEKAVTGSMEFIGTCDIMKQKQAAD